MWTPADLQSRNAENVRAVVRPGLRRDHHPSPPLLLLDATPVKYLAGNRHLRTAQACKAGAGPVLLVLLLLLGACDGLGSRLVPVATLPLPDSTFTTIGFDPDGRLWVAAPNRILRYQTVDRPDLSIPVPDADGIEWVGWREGAFFAAADRLVSVAGDRLSTSRGDVDAVALDPFGRWIFRSEELGSVVIHELPDLLQISGWAAMGAPSNALGISPEGDRVYQSVGDSEYRDGPELLVRDLQTGRSLRRLGLPWELHGVATLDDGLHLVGVGWDEAGEGGYLRVEWVGGSPDIQWTRSLGSAGLEPPVRMRFDAGSGTLGLLGINDEADLRLIDAETGQVVRRSSGRILDFAFGPSGSLYLLYPGAVTRYR